MNNKLNNDNKDKCISIFLLHALGDTIGFKNGIWEFNFGNSNYGDIRITIEIISEFISLGGISHIDLKDWNISDDTLLNYEIAKFILNIKNKIYNEDDIIKLKRNILKMLDEQIKSKIERGFGSITIRSIQKWDDKTDQRHELYNIYSGGNGCSMRTLSIGIAYYKDEDLDKLIDTSIITSKLTHNSPIGFLGGFISAYFIKLALNNIPIEKWPFMAINMLESDKIKSYIDRDNDNIYFDYRNSIKVWKRYVELFFSEDKKPLKLKTSENLISRFKIMYDIDKSLLELKHYKNIAGGNGQSAIIMAYNAVLDCDGNWEKLVYYSMLHGGDSDTVGAIAGGFYGAIYGSSDVPEHLLKHLEMKKELIEIGEKYYEKYFA
jgi:ADP-ribosylarginine hydrolase